MPNAINIGTKDIPLKMADKLTQIVNKEWNTGEFLNKVTPVTRELLIYWFDESFCNYRNFNFHLGQKQAVLNTIYVHEVLKSKSSKAIYQDIGKEFLQQLEKNKVDMDKYDYPKYGIKMATGTGKTWVMHALIIWQYLNARSENKERYSKNFLLIAPGLIVYERLLDSYLGKENKEGLREFNTSDIKKYEELFVPEIYRSVVTNFIQNSAIRKEEIGSKVVGEGIIAITNWHLLVNKKEDVGKGEKVDGDVSELIKDILPIIPGKTDGHKLDVLDNNYVKGRELDFLSNLNDIVIINDEAHHIHENKVDGEIADVEWQRSLDKIAENKGQKLIQIDFSATPYNVSGSGQKRTKHYFIHIIVDFQLSHAIQNGLVKMITLDKRKELASKELGELDFKAVREGRKVVGLSEGQKIMLRAGLQKLKILETQFVKLTRDEQGHSNKYPKMLVMCEDTNVSPFVVDYLTKVVGMDESEVIQIDSDRKGEVKEDEWNKIKQTLFNIDVYERPKVVVSVLMLREGFDVNNICVIVPLRSSEAPILLEQILGRGLRLMWREKEYLDIKDENRKKLLGERKEPSNYLDILSVIEHPRFIQFYEDLIREGNAGESKEMPNQTRQVVGDMITVKLKEDYKEYDMYFPIIIQDSEEIILDTKLNIDVMMPYTIYPLEKLKEFLADREDAFYSEELTVKTRFGNYMVPADIFNAQSYNEYIAKIINAIAITTTSIGKRKIKKFPFMQVNTAELAGLVDRYIRYKLFNQEFNPLEDSNWRVLLLNSIGMVEHIVGEVSKAIYDLQNNVVVTKIEVFKKYFSEVDRLNMRENYSIQVEKSIFERLPYPVNRGGLEKDFIEYCDTQAEVKKFIKINEYYHEFANLNYIRKDGLIATYFPDFMINIGDQIYLVETKADKDIDNVNVRSKEKSAYTWVSKINELDKDDRMNCKWSYVLLSEDIYYEGKRKGLSIKDILEIAQITRYKVKQDLFSFMEEDL